MLKYLSTLLLLLCFTATSLRAQVVRGRVVCPDDTIATAYVSIILTDTTENNTVAKTITDKHGNFVLRIDNYTLPWAVLKVDPTLMGYQSITRKVTTKDFPKVITLYPKETQLGEAVVRANYLTPTPSGYTYDMNRFKKNFGNLEAYKVLDMLPGMRYDQEKWTLTINGRPITEIYVNGQRAGFYELMALTADMLKTAEIDFWEGGEITEKERSATLRIKLDKNKLGGYYMSLYDSHAMILAQKGDKGKNVAHEYLWWKSPNGKWNVKNNAIYSYIGNVNKVKSTQENVSHDTKEENLTHRQNQSHLFQHGLSVVYEFNSLTNVGINYAYTLSKQDPFTRALNEPQATYDRYTVHNKKQQHEFTASFSTEWGKRHNRFDVIADYLTSRSHISQYAYSGLEAQTDTGYTAFGYRFASDMVKNTMRLHLPLSKNISLRLSDATQWIESLYRPKWEEQGDAPALGTQITPSKNTVLTHFSAAYLMGSYRRFYYSAGFNVRTLDSRYRTITDTIHYTQWAFNPRANLKLVLDDTQANTFEVGYYRELGNVPYSYISKKVFWSDANHYTTGNPNLKAKVEHNLRMQLMHLQGKLALTCELSKVENEIVNQTFADPNHPNVYYTQPRNISGERRIRFIDSYTWQPLSWMSVDLDLDYDLVREKQEVSGINYNGWSDKLSFGIVCYTRLPKSWNISYHAFHYPEYRQYNRTYSRKEHFKIAIDKEINNLRVGGYMLYETPIEIQTRTASGYVLHHKDKTPGFCGQIYISYRLRGKRQVHVKEVNAQQKYGE